MAEGAPATEWPLWSRSVGSLPPAPQGSLVITTPASTRCLLEDLVSRCLAASSGEPCGGFSALIYMICLKKFAGVRIFIEVRELRNDIQPVR